MSNPESSFIAAGQTVKNSEQSQMFGKPCFKVKGKAFCCFFEDCMVFKLGGQDHAEALKLKDAKLFDPSGTGRAMKEWVQVTAQHEEQWVPLAKKAARHVSGSVRG
jgi:hypothetical protein